MYEAANYFSLEARQSVAVEGFNKDRGNEAGRCIVGALLHADGHTYENGAAFYYPDPLLAAAALRRRGINAKPARIAELMLAHDKGDLTTPAKVQAALGV